MTFDFYCLWPPGTCYLALRTAIICFTLPGRYATGLIRHILFENFWSFLLVLSGVVDIAIGLGLAFTGVTFTGPQLPVFAICLITGAVYLSLGIVIAVVGRRKKRK